MIFKNKKQEKEKAELLIKQYGSSAFMYTQYPHKRFWAGTSGSDEKYKSALISLSRENTSKRALLYIHIPYCQQLCYFCTCHMSITKNYNKVKDYMQHLYKEIDMFAKFVSDNDIALSVKEIHLGGGSPTFVEVPEFDILCEKLNNIVNLQDLDEFAIEVDPRRVDKKRIRYYAEKGINRISLGVQDFDINVQNAINRVQPVKLIEDLFTEEIKNLFPNGISFDIICGLPNQTLETIKMTAKECARLAPDRICLNFLHYAPRFAPHQEIMKDGKNNRPENLPDFYERKELFKEAQKILELSDYVRTGYDHFAKSTDKVSLAMKEGKMHWNSLGVTPGEYTNIIGLGVSSESTIDNKYFQNYYNLEEYQSSIENNTFSIYRSHELSKDDIIRKDVIQKIRNYFQVDIKQIEAEYGISFKDYFSKETEDLKIFEKDGILDVINGVVKLNDFGRQFTNIVCRSFDKYFSGSALQQDLGQRVNSVE